MMGAAAVTVVVVCAAMYTIFEVIERRKRKKFAEDIRRYIQNHKGNAPVIIKTCVDCGAVILSNNVTARRCPVCAERFAERVRKKYKNPPADPLTADVRKADAAGKSYGYWRLDKLLKEQKAREELDNLIERNRERRERKEHEQQQEKA